MHTAFALYRLHQSASVRRALKTLVLEVRTLVSALAQPNRFIADVKAMHALQLEAARADATQASRAASLRWRAAQLPR